jgi:adenylate cyclase
MTPSLRLTSFDGDREIELANSRLLVVGRTADADIRIPDPTISRRHAELRVVNGGVSVQDLGSFNGTFINGVRVRHGTLSANDSVAFGKVIFRLKSLEPVAPAGASETIVGELQLQRGASALGAPDLAGFRERGHRDFEREAVRLARLLDVAQRLSGEMDLDELLHAVVETIFDSMSGDRVSILLRDAQGKLVPRLSRTRLGEAVSSHVPRSIAERAVAERVAILSHNAMADSRFAGDSILHQKVGGAMCTPLMAGIDQVLGVLYIDSLSATDVFTEENLQFLAAFGGIAAVSIRNVRDAEQIRRDAMIRANFERYFAPRVAAAISQDQREVQLGGARRPLAILFSDIRGFTSLAEHLSPEAVATLLNEYFTEMVDIVFDHEGTLDKFMGDGMLALWGAPTTHPDDADRSVRAAIAMQRTLVKLNERWHAEARPTLSIGIGISYGEAFVGNIGSHRRLEYSVLGDTVNTASRLCGQAGAHEILVTGSVCQALKEPRRLVKLAPIALKGKEDAIIVYRISYS